MQLDEAFGHSQPDARTLMMDRIDLIEVFEDALNVFHVDARACVGHFEHQPAPLPIVVRGFLIADRHGDCTIFGCELEGIAHQVEEDALQLLHVGHRAVVAFAHLQLHVDVLLVGQSPERIETYLCGFSQIDGHGIHLELAALKLSEVEHLVYQTLQHLDVLLRQGEQLAGFLIAAIPPDLVVLDLLADLLQRGSDERKWGAEVVAHVGEEEQLGLGGLIDLLAELAQLVIALGQLVTLRLEQVLLPVETLVETVLRNVVAIDHNEECQRQHQEGKHYPHQHPLQVVLLPVVIDTSL